MLFTITSANNSQVAILDLKKRTWRTVVSSGSDARYVPSGHIVYYRAGTLFAAPFDLKRQETRRSRRAMDRSLPTAAGWRTNPWSPARRRFTCSRFRNLARRSVFPPRPAVRRWSRNGRELFYWSFLPVQQLLAVVNWFEELRHRVPVKR